MIRYSSLTKKFIMAFAGLFLILFLPVHLGINLLILPITENHRELFDVAVKFMTTNLLTKVFEIFLFAGFIIHIFYGVVLQIQNWRARPKRYKVEGWSHTSFFSKFMIHTGVIIFIFLIIHFINFYFVKLGITQPPQGDAVVVSKHDFYNMAVNLFSNTGYSVLYILLLLFVGFHLNHSIQSAFQSLGLNHSKYTPAIKWIGNIYSIVITVGFIVIPLYFIIS
ncbi:MAG: succinate dehydrogenase cytochrome b subunit [Bacteroidetes bacterium]|nr:succinate dehydrogenase cytochrome b subunit [Bacteroidota bacterium]